LSVGNNLQQIATTGPFPPQKCVLTPWRFPAAGRFDRRREPSSPQQKQQYKLSCPSLESLSHFISLQNSNDAAFSASESDDDGGILPEIEDEEETSTTLVVEKEVSLMPPKINGTIRELELLGCGGFNNHSSMNPSLHLLPLVRNISVRLKSCASLQKLT
jgi:type II secretory pathway component PulJ